MLHPWGKAHAAALALLILLGGCFQAARGELLTLPPALTVIEAQAFEGDAALSEALLPESVVSIGPRAFADCAGLQRIYIPAGTEAIAADAFEGVPGPLLIRTQPGSAAMGFALEQGIDFQANTRCRALIIANGSYENMSALPGTIADAQAMAAMLSAFHTTDYAVTSLSNLTAAEMEAAILSAFGEAEAQDLSLFYYSGHGKYSGDPAVNGALMGVDGALLTASALRACLDSVAGRKIVIVDACYSGSLIAKAASPSASGDCFAAAFLQAFSAPGGSPRSRAADRLNDNGYYVLCAAKSSEESYEYISDTGESSIQYGVFTRALCLGCGYDLITQAFSAPGADRDGNGVITLQEAYSETLRNILKAGANQTPQVWPAQCTRFGLLRK